MADSAIPGFEQPESIPLDEQGNIAADVNCLVCGYNLRTQPFQGRCPECGTAVGRSAHGDLLRYCEPGWVETLASGINWIVAGIIASVLSSILAKVVAAATATTGQSGDVFEGMLDFMVSLISLVGYWKLTTPDPGQPDDAGSLNLRSVARWSEVSGVLCLLVSAILSLSYDETSLPFLGLALASGILGLVTLAAVFTYMRQLALRIPDQGLANQTQIVMWGLLVSMGVMLLVIVMAFGTVAQQGNLRRSPEMILPVACIGFVGLAVFVIWSLVLIVRYRRALNQAAQDARSTWAASAAVG